MRFAKLQATKPMSKYSCLQQTKNAIASRAGCPKPATSCLQTRSWFRVAIDSLLLKRLSAISAAL